VSAPPHRVARPLDGYRNGPADEPAMATALREVARIVQRVSGIVLSAAQLPSLQAAIARIDRNLTAASLLEQTLSAATVERLIDEITIRETFFFRHRSELDAIDWYATLDAARARGSKLVRLWVAGCASGEEAYTVAILACEAFASASPPVCVLGTDIAPTALAQARRAHYGERTERTLPQDVRERYFHADGGALSVGARLRSLVEFRRHNLVRDPTPPPGEQPFDVILCRNVLIYFDRPTVERVLAALEGALAPGGLLLLGAADRLSGPSPLLAPHARPGGITQRQPRRSAPPRLAPVRPPTDPESTHPAPGVERSSPPHAAARDSAPRHPQPTPAAALQAADRGELDLAVQIARDVLARDPLDSQAHFIRGVAELAREHHRAAVEPLRRALYIDPNFSLAAFKLAGAHDALGETESARRAYERTLRTLDHRVAGQLERSEQLDLSEIAAACHTRLRALAGAGRSAV
jgi:chemotaxis protein methyltransferase CheR